jgi:hypothetical protein
MRKAPGADFIGTEGVAERMLGGSLAWSRCVGLPTAQCWASLESPLIGLVQSCRIQWRSFRSHWLSRLGASSMRKESSSGEAPKGGSRNR